MTTNESEQVRSTAKECAKNEQPRWLFQREKLKARQRPQPTVERIIARAREHAEAVKVERKARARELRGWLYFIQCATGPVKIGHGQNVDFRLSNLQMGNPNRLTLLAAFVIDDAPGMEEQLHERFAAHHVRGEWFKPVTELLEFAKKFNTHHQASINWLKF